MHAYTKNSGCMHSILENPPWQRAHPQVTKQNNMVACTVNRLHTTMA